MTLLANMNVAFNSTETGTHSVADPSFEPRLGLSHTFDDGVDANMANLQLVQEASLAAAAVVQIDLASGLLNAFGDPMAFAGIAAILIFADAANAAPITLGGGTGNFFGLFGSATDTIKIFPGGFFALSAPDIDGMGDVAAGATKLTLTNTAAGTPANYSIAVLGRDA